jgi:hypothetical protein
VTTNTADTAKVSFSARLSFLITVFLFSPAAIRLGSRAVPQFVKVGIFVRAAPRRRIAGSRTPFTLQYAAFGRCLSRRR